VKLDGRGVSSMEKGSTIRLDEDKKTSKKGKGEEGDRE